MWLILLNFEIFLVYILMIIFRKMNVLIFGFLFKIKGIFLIKNEIYKYYKVIIILFCGLFKCIILIKMYVNDSGICEVVVNFVVFGIGR